MKILLKSIYPYVFMLLYITIPFDNYIRAFPNVLMLILVFIFSFIIAKNDIKKLKKQQTTLFILFFVFLFVNSFFNGNLNLDFSTLSRMMIPLGLLFLYLPINNFKKINKAIIFSSFIAIVFTFIQFIILINQDSAVTILFFQETVDALLIDRIYLGLLCVLSILVSYQSLKKEYHPDNKYYLISIILNLLYVLLIMSKTAIIILIILFILKQFYGKKRRLKILLTACIIIISIAFGFSKFQNGFNNLIKSTNSLSKVNYDNSNMPFGYRTMIWECASKISSKNSNVFFGIGFEETKSRLVKCYNDEIVDNIAKKNFISNEFNTHNQYIDFFISSGLISLLLFIGILIYLLYKNYKLYHPTALIVTLIIFGIVENYFNRQVGAYYFGFILIMLLINNKTLPNKKIKEPIVNKSN